MKKGLIKRNAEKDVSNQGERTVLLEQAHGQGKTRNDLSEEPDNA